MRPLDRGRVQTAPPAPHSLDAESHRDLRLLEAIEQESTVTQRKARLTYEFMRYSLDFYRDARQHIRQSLSEMVGHPERIALFGTGDVAELVYLLVKQMGLEPVAVFDFEADGHFLGYPVLPLSDHVGVAYDVLIVTILERPAATRKRLTAAGVADDRMLMLHRQPLQTPVAQPANGGR